MRARSSKGVRVERWLKSRNVRTSAYNMLISTTVLIWHDVSAASCSHRVAYCKWLVRRSKNKEPRATFVWSNRSTIWRNMQMQRAIRAAQSLSNRPNLTYLNLMIVTTDKSTPNRLCARASDQCPISDIQKATTHMQFIYYSPSSVFCKRQIRCSSNTKREAAE